MSIGYSAVALGLCSAKGECCLYRMTPSPRPAGAGPPGVPLTAAQPSVGNPLTLGALLLRPSRLLQPGMDMGLLVAFRGRVPAIRSSTF